MNVEFTTRVCAAASGGAVPSPLDFQTIFQFQTIELFNLDVGSNKKGLLFVYAFFLSLGSTLPWQVACVPNDRRNSLACRKTNLTSLGGSTLSRPHQRCGQLENVIDP